MRQNVRNQTALGTQAAKHMDEGRLVPDSIMIELVLLETKPLLEQEKNCCLLLDGFPRTLEQAKALDRVAPVDLVVNLDIPTETIVERIADR